MKQLVGLLLTLLIFGCVESEVVPPIESGSGTNTDADSNSPADTDSDSDTDSDTAHDTSDTGQDTTDTAQDTSDTGQDTTDTAQDTSDTGATTVVLSTAMTKALSEGTSYLLDVSACQQGSPSLQFYGTATSDAILLDSTAQTVGNYSQFTPTANPMPVEISSAASGNISVKCY